MNMLLYLMKNSQLLLGRARTPSIFCFLLRDFWPLYCVFFDCEEQCAHSRKTSWAINKPYSGCGFNSASQLLQRSSEFYEKRGCGSNNLTGFIKRAESRTRNSTNPISDTSTGGFLPNRKVSVPLFYRWETEAREEVT